MDTASSSPAPSTHGPAADTPAAGDPAVGGVAEVMASLERLPDLPVAEHLAVFEAAHARLQAALADASQALAAPTQAAPPAQRS
jgi:hypothetical protein